ncbi:DUF5000 domain-containing lipoprotein [Mariniflexile litorale]|uniref:DUF5000 domain-containing lipoprotein n=1 Tax=Mariniflexile litorale TaxID=3045158 RepID=A0AAU7EGR4_9FLAO|nr:DUF5000 domain-containing lipoprotein [Mariniflexile sp. KMM 9835]MDQ8211618.1 DUF5000 domain-containing lipoprotein [Mariniflexile sp. KMM 9835]
MKKLRIIFLKILTITVACMALNSCEEEARGPLYTDSTIPEPITEAVVTNLPGGAKIEYKLPTTENALFVKATYKRNGKAVSTSSSVYNNSVILEGLRDTSTQEVKLEVVDKSNNVSSSVSVTVNPLAAPVDILFNTVDLVAGFGGVGILYDNVDNIDAEILLYVKDPGTGTYVYNQSLFLSGATTGTYTFRSFPPEARAFAIEIVDRWDNITERYEEVITPIAEVEYDRRNFKEAKLAGDITTGAFGWKFSNLFNFSTVDAGMHTDQIDPGHLVPPYNDKYHIFTIDLGASHKLSRMKWWQRHERGYGYAHGNPKIYDIWGIDERPSDNGASLENGWTLLYEGETIKPSGTPAGIGKNTTADNERASQGEEVEFSIQAPRIRYIRFVTKLNWSSSKFIHLMEVEVYGSPD